MRGEFTGLGTGDGGGLTSLRSPPPLPEQPARSICRFHDGWPRSLGPNKEPDPIDSFPEPDDDLLQRLSRAVVQRYNNRTDKRARYRPKNPDKKPLGDPNVTKLSTEHRRKLQHLLQNAKP